MACQEKVTVREPLSEVAVCARISDGDASGGHGSAGGIRHFTHDSTRSFSLRKSNRGRKPHEVAPKDHYWERLEQHGPAQRQRREH